jgi:hypothetical protein
MTLPADEFMRRFLLHVLPDVFQRIRYYGFLGNRYRREKLAPCRRLLGMPAQARPMSRPRSRTTGIASNNSPASHYTNVRTASKAHAGG